MERIVSTLIIIIVKIKIIISDIFIVGKRKKR